jgi:hypothetical protein
MRYLILLPFILGCATIPDQPTPEIVHARSFNQHFCFQYEEDGHINYTMQDREYTNKGIRTVKNTTNMSKKDWDESINDFRYENLN